MTRHDVLTTCIVAVVAAGLPSCASDESPVAPEETVTITPLASETIGPTGGRIDVASHGVSLDIPPGALSADTEITIGERSDAPARAAGPALELGPDGTTFDEPVRLIVGVDALPPGALPDDLRFVTRRGNAWVDMGHGVVQSTSVSSASAEIALEHFSSYSVIAVDQTSFLYGTFGFATDDVFAFGMGSVIAHYDGSDVTATDVGLGGATRLYDGFSVDASDQLCVGWDGSDGQVWRSPDGALWTPEAVPGTGGQPLFGISGDPSVTIAVGFGGRILFGTGGGWVDESYVAPGGQANVVRHLRDVAQLPGGDAIAVGDEIVLLRDAGAWSEMDVSALFGGNRFFLNGVWARSDTEVYAVGREFDGASGNDVAAVLAFDGSVWSRMNDVPQGTAFHGVWGDASRLVVAGEAGQILRYESGTWSDETLCETSNQTFFDVWASAPDFASAVGGGAVFALAMEECEDPGGGGGGGGSGEPGDLVVTFDGAPPTGCDGTFWSENGASLDLFESVDGSCLGCGYTGDASSVRLHPAQLRIILPGQYARCEVDVTSAGGGVTVNGWYAGEVVASAVTTATGATTISMTAWNDEGFYLIYVAACDATIDEVRFYLE